MEIKIKKVAKEDNKFKVEMELMEGEILAIKHALENRSTPVAANVCHYLQIACEEVGIK